MPCLGVHAGFWSAAGQYHDLSCSPVPDREKESASEGDQQGEREADSLLNREPDMGFDPRTLRSGSELKAGRHLTD